MHFFASWISRSKQINTIVTLIFLSLLCVSAHGQTTSARISVASFSPPKFHIEIQTRPASEWSFRNTAGAFIGLAERIENFQSACSDVIVKRLAPGEFSFSKSVTNVTYDVRVTPPTDSARRSRVSWLDNNNGLLLIRDLLPDLRGEQLLNLQINLPSRWWIASSRDQVGFGKYVVSRPDNVVFLIGKSLNSYQHQLGATKIRVTSIGYWVSEHTLKEIAAKILQEHSRTAGQAPPNDIALILIPYDDSSGPERWSAETIGENVVLAMGRRAAEKALAARLQVALDHEFFHLWIPNGIRLRGDYDWFFEGFTLYQALLAGVRLKHLHFDDYLETLARVYASYLSATERDKLSLLEASERRWTTSSSLVYDKGMLVAFIYDLMLRRNSNGRESLPSIYPLLLREAAAGGQDANELIMRLLDGRVGMQGFSTQYVQAQSEIDLSGLVGDFGIQVVNFGSSPQIKVKKPLTKEQRLLLKTLGYKG